MSAELKGKVALVTGASRGLGEGAARALAAAGAMVMLVARDGALTGQAASDIAAKGGEAIAVRCDVSQRADVKHAGSFEPQARLRDMGRAHAIEYGVDQASSEEMIMQTAHNAYQQAQQAAQSNANGQAAPSSKP